jgi:hypothetical protein
MNDLDDVLDKATVIVKNDIDPNGQIENQKPLPDELVFSFFQVRNADLSKEEVNHLKEISDYLNGEVKANDRLDKLQLLREIRFRLGEPSIGLKRHEQVYQYIKLKQASKKYAQEAQAMEG